MSGHEDAALVAELRGYVETLEAAQHANGWDQPARLYRIHRGANGALASDEVYLDLLNEDPVVSVQLIAALYEEADKMPQGLMSALLGAEPTIAYASINEAWAHEYGSREERDRETKPLADVPGSYEVRIAVALLEDTLLSYVRKRGQKPAWADDRPVTAGSERLTAALVRLYRGDRAMTGARTKGGPP